MKKLAFLFCLFFLFACSGQQQEEKATVPATDSVKAAATTVDTSAAPQAPEGYKSIHQTESEEHKGEPSRIK